MMVAGPVKKKKKKVLRGKQGFLASMPKQKPQHISQRGGRMATQRFHDARDGRRSDAGMHACMHACILEYIHIHVQEPVCMHAFTYVHL